MSRHLDPDLFDVGIFALRKYGNSLEREHIQHLHAQGIKTFTTSRWDEKNPYNSFFQAFLNLREIIQQPSRTIIHSHSEFTDILAIMTNLFPNAPKIMRTVHYGYAHEWRKRPLRRLFFTNLLYPLLFNLEIGVSPSITYSLNERLLAQRLHRQAMFLPNAIDINRFRGIPTDKQHIRKILGVPETAILILSIGRLTEQKGFTYLVNAVQLVRQQFPNVYFLIVGEGELERQLATQVNVLGLKSSLQFAGPRQDIELLLQASDLFVSSSLWEGLPTVILESMAAGVPVIATDIPGSNDLIEHKENGWLSPPRDFQALAATILEALNNRQKWREYSIRAQRTVEAFAISEIAVKHQEVYQQLTRV